MYNFVHLDGYISNTSVMKLFFPYRDNQLTLNVPKGGDSQGFYYIPIVINGKIPNNEALVNWFVGKIHVEGKLETYPDSRGNQHWHVVANLIRLITENPFASNEKDRLSLGEKDYKPLTHKIMKKAMKRGLKKSKSKKHKKLNKGKK